MIMECPILHNADAQHAPNKYIYLFFYWIYKQYGHRSHWQALWGGEPGERGLAIRVQLGGKEDQSELNSGCLIFGQLYALLHRF